MERVIPMELTELEKRMVLNFARCNMSITGCAKKMNYARNSVAYHLRQVKRKTGRDPKKFYELAQLVLMIKRGE